MADCLLVPQVFNAERFNVDLTPFPRVVSAAETARALPAFAAAHPDRQPEAETT
jgi:maleylpyruvate isomerase